MEYECIDNGKNVKKKKKMIGWLTKSWKDRKIADIKNILTLNRCSWYDSLYQQWNPAVPNQSWANFCSRPQLLHSLFHKIRTDLNNVQICFDVNFILTLYV